MQVWNILHAARWNAGRKKIAICASSIAQLCRAISSHIRHVSTIRKNVLKSNISPTCPQYGELRPTNSWDRLASFGHPSKFQRVSRFGFVIAGMSLNGGQPSSAQCLAVSWACTLYIHFGGSCPLTEFCQVQNSLYVQVLRFPILAALLHGTRAVGVSQALRRGTRNGIKELL